MNLMQDNFFVRTVDHRISMAVVLFFLLMLMGGKRRPAFALRAICAFAGLCAGSWAIRYVIDTRCMTAAAQGLGFSCHFMLMAMLYFAAYALCYQGTAAKMVYMDMLAMTVFKLGWNTFKAFGLAGIVSGFMPAWSRYSVMGAGISYLVYLSVGLLAYMAARSSLQHSLKNLPLKPVLISAAFYFGFQMGLEYCGHVFTVDMNAQFLYYFCVLAYTIINYSVLLLVAQCAHYQRANANMQAFIHNKMQYYRMSREGIASLQMKCHDLKHQIAAIRSGIGKDNFEKYIDRLEDSIIEYGTLVECGNEALNVVLTEKNILCSSCNVKFSYMLDGALFDFMTEMEIYSLFGNALDNALESCSKVKDPHKRVISLKADKRGGWTVLHVENFFDEKLTMVDGLPVTTKGESGHGFGLRSIQEIAEKYGGVVSVQTENHIFKLTVLMKRPEA